MTADRERLAAQRARLAKTRRRVHAGHRLIALLKKRVALTKRRIRAKNDPGAAAAKYLLGYVGKTETDNHAPFLSAWWQALNMTWMDRQPWCGGACVAAWELGASHPIPHDTVYTPNIAARAGRGDGFTKIDPDHARPGDLIVYDFAPGTGADHVGLALGPMRGGSIRAVEGNTSPGNSGSQAAGGGVFIRERPRGLILCIARPQ